MKQQRKPEVIYKPKSKINKLTAEHAPHLENIIRGGLLRKVTPEHIERHFLEEGYIHHAVGGLMATDAGHYAFMQWEKEGRK